MIRKNDYIFTSVYSIDKNAEEIWNKLTDVESWPGIWKYFRYVSIMGKEKKLSKGSVVHCRVRAAMFYNLDFYVLIREAVPFERLDLSCSGDLRGEGKWLLKRNGGSVESVFEWKVSADSLLLKFIEMMPFGNMFLRYNHRIVMDEGYRSFLKE